MTAPVRDINEAMNKFMDESSEMTLENRFDNLLQQMIAFGFYIIDRQRRDGVRISDEEKQWQKDSMEQLKIMQTSFSIAKKLGRLSTKPNENFEKETLHQIKNMKSSIGDIVRSIPPTQKNGGTV